VPKTKRRLLAPGDGGIGYGTGNALLIVSAQTTTQQTTKAYDAGEFDDAIVYINITNVGTATLIVNYQISPDDGVTWFTLATTGATPLSANGQTALAVHRPIGCCWRVQGVYGGTGPISYILNVEFAKDMG
jgi:hypothetical protein